LPYSVDRTLYPKNETSQENSTDSKANSKVICAYYDVLGEPCPLKDLSSPKPRGEKLSFKTRLISRFEFQARHFTYLLPKLPNSLLLIKDCKIVIFKAKLY
jgi:hypothetical protein